VRRKNKTPVPTAKNRGLYHKAIEEKKSLSKRWKAITEINVKVNGNKIFF